MASRGIFTGPDPLAHKVIATGDPLFGSSVRDVGFFEGLNNRDDVAFRITREPAGVACAAVAGLFLSGRRTRRAWSRTESLPAGDYAGKV